MSIDSMYRLLPFTTTTPFTPESQHSTTTTSKPSYPMPRNYFLNGYCVLGSFSHELDKWPVSMIEI